MSISGRECLASSAILRMDSDSLRFPAGKDLSRSSLPCGFQGRRSGGQDGDRGLLAKTGPGQAMGVAQVQDQGIPAASPVSGYRSNFPRNREDPSFCRELQVFRHLGP